LGQDLVYLMPQLTVLIGLLVLVVMRLLGEEDLMGIPWSICLIVLSVASIQEVILSRTVTTLFMSGAFAADRITHFTVLMSFLSTIFILVNCRYEKWRPGLDVGILGLLAALFGSVTGISNHWTVAFLSFTGFFWAVCGLVMSNETTRNGTVLIQSFMRRSIFFILVGVLLMVFFFLSTGHFQLDEIERAVAKPQQQMPLLFAIEGLLALFFVGSIGLVPWQGVFPRLPSSWSLGLGARHLLSVVSFGVFIRWSVIIFTRPSLEPGVVESFVLQNWPLLLRSISTLSLILIPILVLRTSSLRRALFLLSANPMALALFGISLGTRDLMALGLSTVSASVLAVSLCSTALLMLNIQSDIQLREFVGRGRLSPVLTMAFLMSAAFLAGLVPFIGSVLHVWMHRVSGWWSIVLMVNAFFGGWVVARWTGVAYQKAQSDLSRESKGSWKKVWLLAQFVPFLILGIYWKPLFRYGVFSIKTFFDQ